MTGRVSALAADYSVDELDAVADAFGVPALGGPGLQAPSDAVLLRATLDTALRGLVARRAITLGGSASVPRIELLEPHATLLGTFAGAQRMVVVEERGRDRTERRVLFARDDVVVEQQALDHAGIVRMTAHPGGALTALALDPLGLRPGDDPVQPRAPLEVAASVLDRGGSGQGAAADLLHARRRDVRLADTRIAGGRLTRTTTSWIDAGSLGWWRVEPDGREPPAVLRLIPCSAGEPGAVLTEEQWTRT